MGASDRHYFAWLGAALEQFEAQTGALSTLRREARPLALWSFGEQRISPPIAFIRDTLGLDSTRVWLFDKFPRQSGVATRDINALEDLPAESCDGLTLFRASLFIEDPERFLSQARRLLRSGGLAFIDWLHGLSDAPVLTLGGRPRDPDVASSYKTTYADPQFLAEFPDEFAAFVRHVNRPPFWANVEQPGRPVALCERIRRLMGRGSHRRVDTANYLESLRLELGGVGGHLIEPSLMAQHFKVVFRHARYLYPVTKRFNLHLLTVLSPVGRRVA